MSLDAIVDSKVDCPIGDIGQDRGTKPRYNPRIPSCRRMVLKMSADNQDDGQEMENPSTYRGLPGNPVVRG